MRSNVSNLVLTIIEQNRELFGRFVNVYIFGSILDLDKIPGDIDILLVYGNYSSEVQKDLLAIRTLLEREMEMFVDLTVLSIEEEKEVSFLERLNGRCLKLK